MKKKIKNESNTLTNRRNNVNTDQSQGHCPGIENKFDESAKKLRDAVCCTSSFTLKVKANEFLLMNMMEHLNIQTAG